MPKKDNKQKRKISDVVIAFIEKYCKVPEGSKVGQELVLEEFQKEFIRAVYDGKDVQLAILSMARKNGKTALIACLLLVHVVGPLAETNSQIVSAALTRDQAALVFKLASKMVYLNPKLEAVTKVIPSGKTIIGLAKNVEYKALSADGGSNMGISPIVVIADEFGQVIGPSSLFIEALETAQGAYENPLMFVISTQAPSDTAWLSIQIDDSIRSGDPSVVCHLYAADEKAGLLDEEEWKKANPALGVFRSEKDLKRQLKKANRLPTKEASARNLLLNQRVSQERLWLAPSIWKENGGEMDWSVFQGRSISVGLDLSMRNDLTAAVFAACDDDGVVHLYPLVFTPSDTLKERALLDRAPYEAWVRDGHLIAVPGKTITYDWVSEYLTLFCAENSLEVTSIEFDRWRMEVFSSAAEKAGFAQSAEWNEVGQGYKDFSPRCEATMSLMLETKIRHGNHPLLTMAAANAIAVSDPAGSIKLDKSKSTARIDPLVAGVMAIFAVTEGAEEDADVEAMIG